MQVAAQFALEPFSGVTHAIQSMAHLSSNNYTIKSNDPIIMHKAVGVWEFYYTQSAHFWRSCASFLQSAIQLNRNDFRKNNKCEHDSTNWSLIHKKSHVIHSLKI